MTAQALLESLQQRGAVLTVDGATLWVEPDTVLTDADCEAIRETKPALLDALYYREIETGARQPDRVLTSGIAVYIPPGMMSYSEGVPVSGSGRPGALPAPPNPLPPILAEYSHIIDLAYFGELEPQEASLVLTAAVEIAKLATDEPTAERLSKTRRGCVIRLMLDISEVEYRYNNPTTQPDLRLLQ